MSVLNDINVQDGGFVRQLASITHNKDALSTLNVLKSHVWSRMDSADYSISSEWDVKGASSQANAHWRDDNRLFWGTAKGTWEEYLERVANTREFWSHGAYMPTTQVEVREELSRDLLTATFLFPFVIDRAHADLEGSDYIRRLLAAIGPRHLKHGSSAVYSLVTMADSGDDNLTRLATADRKLPDLRSFVKHMGMMSHATSTNVHDTAHAMRRSDHTDWAAAENGRKFLSLAALANIVESAMNRYSMRKGTRSKLRKLYKDEEEAFATAQGSFYRMANHKVNGPLADEIGRAKFGRSRIFAKHKVSSRVTVVALRNLALVRVGPSWFALTREDLLSLKFAAMSHSMWHVYAASIRTEYLKTDPVVAAHADSLTADARSMMAHVGPVLETAARQANLPGFTPVRQEVVEYEEVRDALGVLWAWYISVVSRSIENSRQDYLGRYLSELFSVYTAQQGGELMTQTIGESIDELCEEYDSYGFSSRDDLNTMLNVFDRLPASAIHDFGRLAKIVAAYDVNPMYSFIDRCAKMQKPNPRGKARMTGEFTYEVEEMTAEEKKDSEVRFKCGCRIMLACSDISQRIVEQLPEDMRPEAASSTYQALLLKLKRLQMSVSTAVTHTSEPFFPVPEAKQDEAHRQAMALINSGDQPSNPYAGAYLDTTEITKYANRGDPDLAIIKATSIVPGDLMVAMSNLSGVPRATPTRDGDGRRVAGSGTMVTDFLLDKFPNRQEALAFVDQSVCVASTSDKIETNKYPLKTRVITSMCAEGRRLQGEYEHNNGKVLVHVPGFMVGVSPSDRLKRTYASLKEDMSNDKIRLFGSLDLSSFSAGMHWDIQQWTNEELFHAYGVSDEYKNAIEACTIGTYMLRVECNLRMFNVNETGSNYEGLDGKRNTFMHCVLWYLARCEAANQKVAGSMRSFIYIDDGAFAIEVPRDELKSTTTKLREAMVKCYVEYGFKLNLSKTVISATYMQFLNEIFQHGVHIGYGFRALCHTAAQTFPKASTISEELAVIVGGIRGAGMAGGHSLRLFVGMCYIFWIYLSGVVGLKGRSLACKDAYVLSLVLHLPTISGGFGIPNWDGIFTNMSGNRDAEKLDRIASLSRVVATAAPNRHSAFRNYVKAHMLADRTVKPDFIPTRLTIAHPGTAKFGAFGRDEEIAKRSHDMCINAEAKTLLSEYIDTGGVPGKTSVTGLLIRSMESAPAKLPVVLVEKALSTDPNSAIVTLIAKIASSYLIDRLLGRHAIRRYDRIYMRMGRELIKNALIEL